MNVVENKNLYGEMERDILAIKIANRLITLIKQKQLRPGDRLPPERELAKMMKVSRPSLREALRALQMMNIIENRQGSGNYVTSLEPAELVEHLDIVFTLDESTYHDLFQARKILETGIVQLAAIFATDDEIEVMEKSIIKAAESIDNAGIFIEMDMELHDLILRASKNKILPILMNTINKLGMMSRRKTAEDISIRKLTVEDHRNLVDAIKTHNPEKAKQAMQTHLQNVESKMKEIFGTNKKRANI
jgi:GntR family transcriptional repressor for pyruvate dehydrogenase complex